MTSFTAGHMHFTCFRIELCVRAVNCLIHLVGKAVGMVRRTALKLKRESYSLERVFTTDLFYNVGGTPVSALR